MNLYITDSVSFANCASNLDNARLKAQLNWLAQIISNVLWATDSYDDILKYAIVKKYFWRGHTDAKQWLFPIKNETHSTVTWAKQSPIHLLFILNYYLALVDIYSYRIVGLRSTLHNNLIYTVTELHSLLSTLLNAAKLSNFYSLEEELYRNIPKNITEKNTVIAYQQYLIAQWKDDITKLLEIKEAKKAWKSLSPTKQAKVTEPRVNKKLVWGRGECMTTVPAFAKKELLPLLGDLYNAV